MASELIFLDARTHINNYTQLKMDYNIGQQSVKFVLITEKIKDQMTLDYTLERQGNGMSVHYAIAN